MRNLTLELVELGDAKNIIKGDADGSTEGGVVVQNSTGSCPDAFLSDFDEEE